MNLAFIAKVIEDDGWAAFTARGQSMTPRVRDGEFVTVTRVDDPELIEIGDVVLARVRGRLYLHLVSATRTSLRGTRFQISNNRGHVNGWTRQIIGKLHSN